MQDIFADPIVTAPAGTRTDTSIQKRVMNVFMVVDTSGSMSGDRIGSVNQAIRETIPELQNVQRNGKGVEIRVALMSFNSKANWITPLPEAVDKFTFVNFNATGGTNAADAFELLSDKLSRKTFMNALGGHFAPLILLLSDGESSPGWQSKLEKLQTNMWYKCATRVAIAAGKEATTKSAMELFKAFTENSEMIIYADQPDKIKDFIRLVSVHASQWNSSHTNPNTNISTATKAVSTVVGNTGTANPAGSAVANPLGQDMQNQTPDWWKDLKQEVSFPPLPPIN